MAMGSGALGLRVAFMGALATAAAVAAPARRSASEPVAFVVPAREAAVRMAFDMAALRPSYLVSYQARPGAQDPLLHVWDGSARRWIETNLEAYGAGANFGRMPRTAFFLGTESEFSPKLTEYAGWADRKVRLATLNPMPCLNAFHEALRFTPAEWRWLARRYDLDLRDQNEQYRRYGRYGPPGQPPPQAGGLPPGAAPVPGGQSILIPPAAQPMEEAPALVQPPVEPPARPEPAAMPPAAPAPRAQPASPPKPDPTPAAATLVDPPVK